MTTPPKTPGPLTGVRVLDLSQVVSGPICGRMLADLGAEVVKVEPMEGDIIRRLQPQFGDDSMSVYFSWVNAGKRSIAVDLRDARVAAMVRRLAVTSDVVLENFRPGVMEKFGMGTEALRAENPRLIFCSISGWGAGNSWSQRRAYAAMVQAEAGRVELDARLRGAPAEQSTHVDGDIQPGLLAVSAVCAALYQRERDGVGQHVDVAMAEALLYTDEWASTELTRYDGPRVPDTWRYPVFTVADGTMVAFMGDPHQRLPEIAAAISDEPIGYTESRDEALATLARLFAAMPDFPTVEARMDTFGFLVAQVRSIPDVAETPWAVEREVFTEVEPGVRVTAAPFRSSTGGVRVQGPAPRLGQDTLAVLRETGATDEELAALAEAGLVGTAEGHVAAVQARIERPRKPAR